MSFHLIAAVAASALDLTGSAGYVRDTLRRRTRPHVFSWLVWALLSGIAAAVQYAEGSWMAGLSFGIATAFNTTIFILGLNQGDHNITRGDWVSLVTTLAAIPVWQITNDPLWAVVLISGINIASCYPTFRKAWARPAEENMRSFLLFTGSNTLRLMSVSPLTFVTALYPAVAAALCLTLVGLILFRRRALSPVRAT